MATKVTKILHKRGAEKSMPTLEASEFGYTTDTKKLFFGSSAGNIEVGSTTAMQEVKALADDAKRSSEEAHNLAIEAKRAAEKAKEDADAFKEGMADALSALDINIGSEDTLASIKEKIEQSEMAGDTISAFSLTRDTGIIQKRILSLDAVSAPYGVPTIFVMDGYPHIFKYYSSTKSYLMKLEKDFSKVISSVLIEYASSSTTVVNNAFAENNDYFVQLTYDSSKSYFKRIAKKDPATYVAERAVGGIGIFNGKAFNKDESGFNYIAKPDSNSSIVYNYRYTYETESSVIENTVVPSSANHKYYVVVGDICFSATNTSSEMNVYKLDGTLIESKKEDATTKYVSKMVVESYSKSIDKDAGVIYLFENTNGVFTVHTYDLRGNLIASSIVCSGLSKSYLSTALYQTGKYTAFVLGQKVFLNKRNGGFLPNGIDYKDITTAKTAEESALFKDAIVVPAPAYDVTTKTYMVNGIEKIFYAYNYASSKTVFYYDEILLDIPKYNS